MRISYRLSTIATALSTALLLVLAAFTILHGGEIRPVQQPSADLVRIEGEIWQPQLLIEGRIVLEPAMSHMSPPRISPDGRYVAVSVVPAGSETDHLAQTYLYEVSGGRFLDKLAGHSPRWQESGARLRIESATGSILYDPLSGTRISESQRLSDPEPIAVASVTDEPVVYPETIRVAHHPENNCRDLPDWQVDEIPFEEYVARSVPAEIPIHWAHDALAAQAVAARSYAWYQIRRNRPDYDVTDWANFQMMCDDRFPASDAAVAATAGQYLSASGDAQQRPIMAMYSAINGHPTLDHPMLAYLQAVPDWTGLGKSLYGHGYGLSQWGAAYRARAGQSYRQILGHYYSDVYLENGIDPDAKVAGLLGPIAGGYLPPGGLQWRTLSSSQMNFAEVRIEGRPYLTRTSRIRSNEEISYTAIVTDSHGITQTVTLTELVPVTHTQYLTGPLYLPSEGVWQQQLDLQEGDLVALSLWTNAGRQEEMELTFDRMPPGAPLLEGPAQVEIPTVTVSYVGEEGSRIGLSSAWVWEGEHLSRTVESGRVVGDRRSNAGAALTARVGEHQPGWWFGPYTTDPPADATYRALFRLQIGDHPARGADGLLPHRPIARLDVTDRSGEILLGLRHLYVSDFAASGQYQEIPVDFHIFEPVEGLEVRTQWLGEVDLTLDRIQIWQLTPEGHQGTMDMPLRGITTSIEAIAFDAAGNASGSSEIVVRLTDDGPPRFDSVELPTRWQRTLPVTPTVYVQDLRSGLDFQSGALLVDDLELPATFERPDAPYARQRLSGVIDSLEDGVYQIGFRATDLAGQSQTSSRTLLSLDRVAPVVSASYTGGVTLDGWTAGPISLTVYAEDETSGVSGVAYVLDDDPFVLYTGPFSFSGEGERKVRYWAQDRAGNYSASRSEIVKVDGLAPSMGLSLAPADSENLQLGWSLSDGGVGIESLELEVRRDGGEWVALEVQTSETGHLLLPLEEAEEVEVQGRSSDRLGNRSDWQSLRFRSGDQYLFLPSIERR